ncbi:MAG: trimethylamine methyltransferase family protein [Desulfobacterales bacterium]|nr:trimethylamine methyltransferase family protein [Desulfobacterales bacterium]
MQVSKNQLELLHQNSLRILEEVGVIFHCSDALDLMRSHGQKVDGNRVFIDKKTVAQALHDTPAEFEISARNPDHSITVGGNNLVITPGFGCPMVSDVNGTQRPATMADYKLFCKLVQSSLQVSVNNSLMVTPTDLPQQDGHKEMLLTGTAYTDKPVMGITTSLQAARDSLAMAEILWGAEQLKSLSPVMMANIAPLSPLQYSQDMAAVILEFSRKGQAVLLCGLMQAGATGPVTLPGMLALHNAELLAGLVLTQLSNPGTPVVYGTTSTITNMKSGAGSIGAPEFSIVQDTFVQLVKYYGLPVRGSGGVTDSHLPDIQAGIESALSLESTIGAGANFVYHSCGVVSSYMSMSPEKFLIDEELCAMVRRKHKPIEITEERIPFDSIKAVDAGGQFLTDPLTAKEFRNEFFLPDLCQRDNYDLWQTKGLPSMVNVAQEQLEQRLGSYQKPDIDSTCLRQLEKYVKQ